MKIKIRKINKDIELPKIINKGEWIDLRAAEDTTIKSPTVNNKNIRFRSALIPLGIAMKLPKGYEAIVAPRSSTYSKYGIIMSNSIGVIDSSYSGNNDEWKFPALNLDIYESCINKNERICQFRIQLSQKATIWQKIKWLFTNKIELVEVDNLDNNNRGGFGSTGVK